MATQTFPAVTNVITNPSFETNTTGWNAAAAGSSVAQSGAQAWVGSNAGRVTCTGAGSGQGLYFNRTNAAAAAVQGQIWSAQIRAKAVTGTSTVKLGIEECNNAGTVLATGYGANTLLSAGSWTALTLNYTTANASCAFVSLELVTTSAQNVVFDLDGAMLANEEQPSAYADGDQGSVYHWTGTAHASSSYRDALTAQLAKGTGGVVQMTAVLYKATANGTLLDDISDWVTNGQVVFDATADVHLTFTAETNQPGLLTPWVDYVAPFLTLTYGDGTTLSSQVGLFLVVPGSKTYSQNSTKATIDGRSLEYLLASDLYPNGYTVYAGTDYAAAVIAIVQAQGFNNYTIPLSGVYLPTDRTWSQNTSKLQVCNDLLKAVNYYPLHTNRDGALRTHGVPNIDQAIPRFTYTTATGSSNVVETVTEEPNLDMFANRVVVTIDDPARASQQVIVTNSNASSPVSTVSLGYTKTITYQSALINSTTEATTIALRLLQQAATGISKLTIRTLPDPTHQQFECYTLNINQTDGTNIALGSYYCLGWTLGFNPNQGAMTHTVQKLQVYQ